MTLVRWPAASDFLLIPSCTRRARSCPPLALCFLAPILQRDRHFVNDGLEARGGQDTSPRLRSGHLSATAAVLARLLSLQELMYPHCPQRHCVHFWNHFRSPLYPIDSGLCTKTAYALIDPQLRSRACCQGSGVSFASICACCLGSDRFAPIACVLSGLRSVRGEEAEDGSFEAGCQILSIV